MSKPTLKDVAKMAGVSPSTASRVISGGAQISKSTCDRVMEAVKILRYTPNTAARSLRCEKSGSIGVVFPDISGEFYAGCASSLLKYARLNGYTVLIAESGHDISSERDAIRALMERCVDGIIFIGDSNDDALIYELAEREVPVVTGDRCLPGIPSVTFDNRRTVCELTKSLYDQGRRRFVYVGETVEGQSNLAERCGGYVEALSCFEDVSASTVLDGSFHSDKPKAAYELFKSRIADMKPDAVITSNDLIAYGIISAAQECGIRIPHDMAVTGFDDLVTSAYCTPPVTTVRQDINALTHDCFDMLMKVISGEKTEDKTAMQKIIYRKSAPQRKENEA